MIKQDKISEWVKTYLAHINKISVKAHVEKEEGYKFKAVDNFLKHFNVEAQNLAGMLDNAIANNNMVVGSWYFPRAMLLIFAREYEKETRLALRDLFDESKPIKLRIDEVEDVFNSLMSDRNRKLNEDDHSFVGIRFLSLLLGYRYPTIHNALKPREWKHFCKYIDHDFSIPNGISHGTQYEMFKPCIESLRLYIRTIPEINALRLELTKGLDFHDDEFRWMAQDVIYVTSRVIDEEYGEVGSEEGATPDQPAGEPEEEDGETVTIDDRFAYEEYLQLFFKENFKKIDFRSHLSIYSDSSGKQGYYYSTEYGEIDALAVDENGDFVVIELKRARAADQSVNQLGRYLQWVEEKLAVKNNQKVRGILIAHSCNQSLLGSIRALRFPVSVFLYKLKIELTEFKEL